MKIPVLSGIIFVFILWLFYEIRKSKKVSKETSDEFWQRENNSNLARKANISNLNYITIHPEGLPLSDQEDSTINSYRDTILKLKDKKMLNLSGLSNTYLKLTYGLANFNILSECDNNYNLMISTLQKWGERLYEKGFTSEAIQVLEYATSCNTDISLTYLLLAKIYIEQNAPEKIDSLLQIVTNVTFFHKETVMEELKSMKNSHSTSIL